MKATVEAKALRAALATISKVQASRSALPVLDMIHVAAREDGLELQATDLQRWSSVRVECDVCEEGRTLIRADGLLALAEHASGETIELSGNGEGPRTARGGSASVTLPTLSVSDWPLFGDIESAGEVEVAASVLRDALGRDRLGRIHRGRRPPAPRLCAFSGTRRAPHSRSHERPRARPVRLTDRGARRAIPDDLRDRTHLCWRHWRSAQAIRMYAFAGIAAGPSSPLGTRRFGYPKKKGSIPTPIV